MSDEGIPPSAFGEWNNFGLPKQKTRCKVLVHSHIVDNDLKGVVDCSVDAIACNTSKSIKGGGGAQVTLLPRRNYINYIFPDDWVNIYFNTSDGKGWVRVFFGFVDRVSRTITTAENGQTTTRYSMVCSDFTKAFDSTQIYFNPHVADREDFVGNFAGTKNLAGAALRMRGVTAFGSPADLVMNLTHLLLGFNAQFTVPPRYPVDNSILGHSRKFRRKWIMQQLPADVKKAIGNERIKAWRDSLKAETDTIVKKLQTDDAYLRQALVYTDDTTDPSGNPDIQKKIERLRAVKNVSSFLGLGAGKDADAYLSQLAYKVVAKEQGISPDVINSEDVKNAINLDETLYTGKKSLLDLIDFSFVEYGAIDGSLVSTSIWTQQGSLWSIINAYSNNIINELFCDLRPLGQTYKQYPLQEGGYAFDPDEHKLNAHTIESDGEQLAASEGVRFVPALVMREYPFSTIEDIDAHGVSIFKKYVSKIRVGAIWHKGANQPGRKIKLMKPPLNEVGSLINPELGAPKHLDVAVISVRDIISEEIGRSDADTVNLIELYSDGIFGKHMKFLTQDAQPIVNPVSIARHGLRVRTYNTKFARFSKKHKNFDGVDNFGTRRKLIRWALMLDHWYQHNVEYLNGSMQTRGLPEIRVGYRLDVYERRESYYVEGVNHSWEYPGPLTTALTLSRGQRNDPFPVYEKPALTTFGSPIGVGRRNDSRLGQFFKQVDPSAVLRALSSDGSAEYEEAVATTDSNLTDIPEDNQVGPSSFWGLRKGTYIIAGGQEYQAAQAKRNAETLGAATDVLLKGVLQAKSFIASTSIVKDVIAALTGKTDASQLQLKGSASGSQSKGSGGSGRSQ